MSLIDSMKAILSPPEPPMRAIVLPEQISPRTDGEKIDFHIGRFTRALEQCQKGEGRRAELQANLDYWLAIKAANAALRGE